MIKLLLKLYHKKTMLYFKIDLDMKKKTIKLILEILKYGITLALGYLGKDTGVIDSAFGLLS